MTELLPWVIFAAIILTGIQLDSIRRAASRHHSEVMAALDKIYIEMNKD